MLVKRLLVAIVLLPVGLAAIVAGGWYFNRPGGDIYVPGSLGVCRIYSMPADLSPLAFWLLQERC